MSAEDLRALQVRLDGLQTYIARIPGHKELKGKMDAVRALIPLGRGYDAIVADVRRLLPGTIDSGLVEVQAICAGLGEPWKTHIVQEVGGVLRQLSLFRTTLLQQKLEQLAGR
jgi:hypothetical protein